MAVAARASETRYGSRNVRLFSTATRGATVPQPVGSGSTPSFTTAWSRSISAPDATIAPPLFSGRQRVLADVEGSYPRHGAQSRFVGTAERRHAPGRCF